MVKFFFKDPPFRILWEIIGRNEVYIQLYRPGEQQRRKHEREKKRQKSVWLISLGAKIILLLLLCRMEKEGWCKCFLKVHYRHLMATAHLRTWKGRGKRMNPT